MISRDTRLRIARRVSDPDVSARMYCTGLGFSVLGEFRDHQGFDGVMVGHPRHLYHLEFVRVPEPVAQSEPDPENLLVFYLPEREAWSQACLQVQQAGFVSVSSANPYWDEHGRTYADADGYRLVLQHATWTL